MRVYLGKGEGHAFRRGRPVLRVFRAFQALGPPLTRRAEPVWFGSGVLTLRVFGSAWMTELSFLTDSLAARLNQVLGDDLVQSVRLRAGPPRPWVDDEKRAPKLSPRQLEQVETWGAQIRRPEVKAAVMRAAAAHLAKPVGPPASPRPKRRRSSQ